VEEILSIAQPYAIATQHCCWIANFTAVNRLRFGTDKSAVTERNSACATFVFNINLYFAIMPARNASGRLIVCML